VRVKVCFFCRHPEKNPFVKIRIKTTLYLDLILASKYYNSEKYSVLSPEFMLGAGAVSVY